MSRNPRLRIGEIPLGLDGGGERGARAFERRGEPEENAGDQGDGEDVRKYPEVGCDMEDQGAIFGGEGIVPRLVTDTLSKAQVNSSATTPAIRPSSALSVSNCRTSAAGWRQATGADTVHSGGRQHAPVAGWRHWRRR